MKKRFFIAVLAVFICVPSVILTTEAVEPRRGSSRTTFSASVTGTTTEVIKFGPVYVWDNNVNRSETKTVSAFYPVKNSYGYSSGMGGAKAAIENAVGFDVDSAKTQQWRYTVTAAPWQRVTIGINDKYTRKNVKITRKYEVWLGNSLYPTTSYTYGTGWARQWYAYECYVLRNNI